MRTIRTRSRVDVLDGLRFVAALFVLTAHYAEWMAPQSLVRDVLGPLSGLGMTLFFVLSGFVIHYNYGEMLRQPSGVWRFAVARFARLYPLYIVLFMAEFLMMFRHHVGPCAQLGQFGKTIDALPLYLTLTQDWSYGVICERNLIYQYGSVSPVTWSISAEVLFYAVYALWARSRSNAPRPGQLVCAAVVSYLFLFVFLWQCMAHRDLIEHVALAMFGPITNEQSGYNDSLLRWLVYFAPLSQMPHFIAGVAAAQYFLSGVQKRWVSRCTIAVVVVLFATHFYLYNVVAPENGAIGRTASSLYGPLVALAVYLIAAFPSTIAARPLARPLTVKLGEASYSLYLLHAFLAPYLMVRVTFVHGWALFAVCFVGLLALSRISFLCFERPARDLLRRVSTAGGGWRKSAPSMRR